jgi:alpha-L-rhamnosidase
VSIFYGLGIDYSRGIFSHRGTEVRLRFSELVYNDKRLNTENLRRARVTDTFILAGTGGVEVYEPRFTYHGFRYIELSGYPGAPGPDALRAKVVHTAVQPTGGFASSKPILNQLQRIIVWGQKTNLHSVPTDCDQRDERKGWMGDAHVTAEEAMLNFDMGAFYNNFLRGIRDEQGADGSLTDTVPLKGGQRPADPAWGAAYPLITWYMYQHYGDRRILEENLDGVKGWVDFLSKRSQDGILSYCYYGDWVSIEKTPGALVSTFYLGYSADIAGQMAEILGRAEEGKKYRRLAEDVRAAFHRTFYSPMDKVYGGGSQTAQALAVTLNAGPKEATDAGWSALVSDIVYSHDTHLTTGFIGVKYLMDLLATRGRSDLLYELATQTTFPSWGYMIANGATTVWEL